MKSVVTSTFRAGFGRLPESTRRQASRSYALWRADPHHSSLQFKRVSQTLLLYSVRVGKSHRALGLWEGDTISWFWIGTHAEYDSLLARL